MSKIADKVGVKKPAAPDNYPIGIADQDNNFLDDDIILPIAI